MTCRQMTGKEGVLMGTLRRNIVVMILALMTAGCSTRKFVVS